MSGIGSTPAPSLWRSFRLQSRIIAALMIREGNAKYGHENLGFFWIMIEPLSLAAMVALMWYATNHSHTEAIGLVLFVLTGYCPLTLWRHIAGRSARVIRQRSALLFHANIKPFDVLIAVFFLETIGIFAAFICAYFPLVIFGVILPPRDTLLMIGGWLFLAWFSISVGLIIAALTEMYEPVEKFIGPLLYVTIPLTGVFAMIDWLPQKAQAVLVYSPIATSVEMFRAGAFPEDIVTYYDPFFLTVVCAMLTAIGIPLVVYAQKFVTHN